MPRGKHKNHCIDCNRLFPERELYYDHRCKKCHDRFMRESHFHLSHIKIKDKKHGRQRKTKIT